MTLIQGVQRVWNMALIPEVESSALVPVTDSGRSLLVQTPLVCCYGRATYAERTAAVNDRSDGSVVYRFSLSEDNLVSVESHYQHDPVSVNFFSPVHATLSFGNNGAGVK